MKNIDLSIVIPVYNEEESLELLYNSIINNLENTNLNFEIIFIDDGSSDKSWNVIKTIYEKKTNISSIKFRKNYGKSDALDAGFKASNGTYVLTMDADLQDDPNEIYPLFKMI
ncbi:MAG: glycosyltransferase, partial [Bacteroidota bacterium]|nr:glycosyltransferase [Bacteroidota bacterium]